MTRAPTFVSALVVLYLVYAISFYLATGFTRFFVWDWRVFQKGFLVLGPLYLAWFWSQRETLRHLDYHAMYLPLVSWAVAFVALGASKGMMNAVVVEPPLVLLLMGLYLTRLWLARRTHTDEIIVASVLLGVTCVGGVLVAALIPAIGD